MTNDTKERKADRIQRLSWDTQTKAGRLGLRCGLLFFGFLFELLGSHGVFDAADARDQSDQAPKKENGRDEAEDQRDELVPPDKSDKDDPGGHGDQTAENG